MRLTPRARWIAIRATIFIFAMGCITAVLQSDRPIHAGQTAPLERTIQLGAAREDALYAITVAVKDPARIRGTESILVKLIDAKGEVASKWLHTADLDFYMTLRPRQAGPVTVHLSAEPGSQLPEVAASMARMPVLERPSLDRGVISAAPNGTWQTAQMFELGQTIFGSADERPYAPSPSEDGYAALMKGFQWFRFKFHEDKPSLVYFVLNVTDRDVPLDVDIFQSGKNGDGLPDVVPFTDGQFVYKVEATQNYPGHYNFRTRILQPGHEYYVRVAANHPAYQLHTYEYSVPPGHDAQRDPHDAVRAGMDFLVNMGDSWLSNTPRRGAIALRTTMQHSETQLCIACHPTQFTTRGYLKAVENGYPPTMRAGLEFLTDRIYNNARPLYGEPNTNWVRIIYTARTEASRLPLIAHAFEQNVTHDAPRKKFDLPYAEFLKIHYKGVTQMPGDEADGCEPDVSPFEIATQSWQTFNLAFHETQDRKWTAERDHVEQLAIAADPKNMIDLSWKIMFLAETNRAKNAATIDSLIDKLYSYETPDGGWPYPFDTKAKTADFISYNAVLALAEAGRRPETDPHLAIAVKAMLAAQRPEGSWEGDPVYQGFNTPFRATQFAVMALSTLYPGKTKAKNWDAAYPPPPRTLATNDLPLLLQQLDQFWDLASQPQLHQIRSILESSNQPLAREAAARALGHMADPGAIPALLKGLGDQSKMVQTASAYALRMVLSRRPDTASKGRRQLAQALASPDARTRFGAARVFNQHFRDLTDDPQLLAALEHDLSDPVPAVRFEAAGGIWRWYYWQVDKPEVRRSTLRSLAVSLNTEQDPMVRRGLQESIYNLLDENTGYLSAWVRASAKDDDKDRINAGYEAVARDQAQVLAEVIRAATPLGREGILNALWDFHIRHYALPRLKADTVSIGLPAVLTKYVESVPDLHRPGYEYSPYREAVDFKYDVRNGFFQTRIGNDSDLIHFFKSSGPELENALLACLKGADDNTKIEVLKAGSTLSEAGDARFTLAALELSQDKNAEVRQTVRYVYEGGQRGILNLDTPTAPDPKLVDKVVDILHQGDLDSQAIVLPLLASLPENSAWHQQPSVQSALRSMLEQKPRVANYAAVLDSASSFPALLREPDLQKQVFSGLDSFDTEVERAAVRICFEHFLNDPQSAQLIKPAFANLNDSALAVFIEEAGNPNFLKRRLGVAGGAVSQDQDYLNRHTATVKIKEPLEYPIVVDTIMQALLNPDGNVSAAALDTLRKVNHVEQRQDFRSAMKQLQHSTNPRMKLISSNVLGGKNLSDALREVQPGSVLDFRYFVDKIEPILAKPGRDGKACVFCHESHVIFKLAPPNTEGVFSDQDSESNYKFAMRVVDISEPDKSLILIKPTRPSDSAGNVGNYLATHNGGQRWQGNETSDQYRTILAWIRGARLQAANQRP